VHLGNRAQTAIGQIDATAAELREELLADIPKADLRRCMEVLERIKKKAELADKISKAKSGTARLRLRTNGGNGHAVKVEAHS
jgi:hypothetical protein